MGVEALLVQTGGVGRDPKLDQDVEGALIRRGEGGQQSSGAHQCVAPGRQPDLVGVQAGLVQRGQRRLRLVGVGEDGHRHVRVLVELRCAPHGVRRRADGGVWSVHAGGEGRKLRARPSRRRTGPSDWS